VPLWDRPPIDAISVSNALFSSGTFRITGGPGVVVGSDASGASISAAVAGSFWENGVPQVGDTVGGMALGSTSLNTNVAGGRLLIQPMSPANELFPFNISATRADLDFWGGKTTSSANWSAAFSSTFFLGFYTRVNSTQLSIVNSVSKSFTGPLSSQNSSMFVGPRFLSFHSSAFSSAPNFTEGGRYWFAQLVRTSGAIYTETGTVGNFQLGMYQGGSTQRSGQIGVGPSSGTSSNAWYPFMGVHSLTTHTSLPGTLGNSDINKASTNANFIPHLMLNAGLAPVD
jgi:hypothetical protein